jgi:uncharacterized membrane protein
MVNLSPRAGKWVLAALVVSLGLNLFVGGVVIGRGLHHHRDWSAERPSPDREHRVIAFIGRMAMALPPEDRAKFMAKMEGYRAELVQADRNFRDARKKVQDAIAAEPFDRNALESALGDVQAKMGDLQKVLHRALSDAVSALPPDARRKLASWDGHDDRSRDRDRDDRDDRPGKDGE